MVLTQNYEKTHSQIIYCIKLPGIFCCFLFKHNIISRTFFISFFVYQVDCKSYRITSYPILFGFALSGIPFIVYPRSSILSYPFISYPNAPTIAKNNDTGSVLELFPTYIEMYVMATNTDMAYDV